MSEQDNKQQSNGESKWASTGVTNLIINTQTGDYYLQAKIKGQYIRRCLFTKKKSEAKIKLPEEILKITKEKDQGIDVTSALTFKQCLDLWFQSQKDRQIGKELSENYITSLEFAIKNIEKIYPENFRSTLIRKVTLDDLRKPYNELWKSDASATKINTVLVCLHGVYEVALEKNAVAADLSLSLKRKTADAEVKDIPDDKQLVALLADITRDDSCNKHKHHVADYIRFLCFSGARNDEAKHVQVRDIHFEKNRIHLRICKGGAGTEKRARFVPIAPQALPLLKKLAEGKKPNEPLLKVKVCRRTLKDTCSRLGLPRYTHHTFRHVFATRALEATGCDFFTVSKWLGHVDGGKLLGGLYAHLKDEHSQKQIAKVSFNFGAVTEPVQEPKPALASIVVDGQTITAEQIKALLAAQKAENVVEVVFTQNEEKVAQE